jgi:hypothetical protein
MGSVSNDDSRSTKVVRATLDTDQGQVRVFLEGPDQLGNGNQIKYSGEVVLEKCRYRGLRLSF